MVTALPQCFESTLNPCFLYVASELIKTFGDEPQHDAELGEGAMRGAGASLYPCANHAPKLNSPTIAGPMLARMMVGACSGLRSLQEVGARPDLADDTFLLAGRALSYAPRLVLKPQLLPVLLDAVMAGLLVQHREACCSILGFVVRLLDPATHRKCATEALGHLQAALAPRAPLLVRLLLAGAAGALPLGRQAELTDVLHALLKVRRSFCFSQPS